MAGRLELVLPGGGRLSASLPLNQHMQRQLDTGVLKIAEPEPDPGLVVLDGGGEGGAERGSAPPDTIETPAPPVATQEGASVETPGQPIDGAADMPPPAANASREEWAAFAITQGMHPDEAGQLKRDEIKARFGPDDPAPTT